MAKILDDFPSQGMDEDAIREGMMGVAGGGNTCRICGVPVDKGEESCGDEHAKEIRNRRRRKTHAGMLRGDRERLLQMAVGGIGFTVIGTAGDDVCGTAIIEQAEDIAWNLEEVAAINPSVDRTLGLLSKGSGWVGLAAACFPIISTVYTHHFMAEGGGAKENGHKERPDDVVTGVDFSGFVRSPVEHEGGDG